MGTRTVPMQVLCLGMGRTGTQSLSEALPLLGISPVYHMKDVRKNSHTDLWSSLFEAKQAGKPISTEQFDEILGSWAGTTDWPSITFAEELMDAYPDARIILTTRSEDAWLASMNSTLFLPQPGKPPSKYFVYQFGEEKEKWHVNAKEAFRKHNDNVRKLAKERGREVLEYQVKEGWGPLCKFLGKDVPEGKDFPRSDDWATFGWKKVVEPVNETSTGKVETQ